MKDNWTAIGIGGALFCVVLSIFMDGGNPAILIKPAPMILVFGGTFFAGTAGFMKSDLKGISPMIKAATKAAVHDVAVTIEEMARLAAVAKQNGILALEKESKEVSDPFLRRGLELAADGTNSEEIREVLETEIANTEARHQMGAKLFSDMSGFAPTLGIIGTVIGLVRVLGNLSSPGSLGPAIASAFTATLWGVLTANLIWLPIANKLKRASHLEIQVKLMIVEGLLSIQSGATSRFVRARMESFLPSQGREHESGGAAA
jgi:chemotaxis protein MotA